MDDGPIVISSGSASTPESVAAKTFATSFRGYDQNEVRAYLKRVAAELSAAATRESELQVALSEAHKQVANPDLDEETLTAALGEQAARLLTNAREAASNIEAEAEKRSARIIGEAEVRIARVRSEADGLLARRSEEADRMTSGLRQAAEATARTLRDRARAEAEAEVESARKQGREMVGEARAVRERMLADLTRRRRTAEAQIEHLRTARVRLLEAYSVVRRTLDEATHELGAAEAEAGPVLDAAAGRAPRRTDTAVDEGRRSPSPERRSGSGPGTGRTGEQHQQRPAVDAPSAQQLAGPLGRGLVSVGGGGPHSPSPVEVEPDPPSGEPPSDDPPPAGGPILIEAPTAIEATPDTDAIVESSSGAAGDDGLEPESEPEPIEAVAPRSELPGPAETGADAPPSPPPDASHPKPGPLVTVPSASAPTPLTSPEPPANDPAPTPAPEPTKTSAEVPPAVAPEPPLPAATPPSADELFARLRAAQATPPPATKATKAPPPAATPAVSARSGSSSSSENGSDNAAAAPISDQAMPDVGTPLTVREESALAGRDQVLEPIQADLVRRLRRVLQDEQNEVLDRLRRERRPAPDTVLPPIDEHVERYQSAATALLGRAADGGAELVSSPQDAAGSDPSGGGGTSGGWPVEQWAADLAVDLVVPLRDRLESAITEAMPGPSQAKEPAYDTGGVSEKLGASYRQWKATEIEQAVRHHASAAFSRGSFAATPAGAQRCWVVDDDGGPCPDCDDNTLAGPVTKGEPFPTGQPHPPAHGGCRCILVAPPS